MRTLFAGMILATSCFYSNFVNAAVRIEVDWSVPAIPLRSNIGGLNQSATKRGDQAAWRSSINYLSPAIIRLHVNGKINSWYDQKLDNWNYHKINDELSKERVFPDAMYMINIDSWPKFMSDENGRLDQKYREKFARRCGELASYIKKNLIQNAIYWELFNEKEDNYSPLKNPKVAFDLRSYSDDYILVARAIHDANHEFKVGGPAVKGVYRKDFLIKFAEEADNQLDFLSLHYYPTGSRGGTLEDLLKRMETGVDAIERIAGATKKRLNRDIPIFVTEYNINYNWRTPDDRMASSIGAVFDFAFLKRMIYSKEVYGAFAWSDMDGTYGKFDAHGRMRPPAKIFHWLNSDLRGFGIIPVRTSDQNINAIAGVLDHKRFVILSNMADADVDVSLAGVNSRVPWRCESTTGPVGCRTEHSQLNSLVPAQDVVFLKNW